MTPIIIATVLALNGSPAPLDRLDMGYVKAQYDDYYDCGPRCRERRREAAERRAYWRQRRHERWERERQYQNNYPPPRW